MTLCIDAQWLRGLDDSANAHDSPEDEGTLSEICVLANGALLTAASDSRTSELRRGANLSAHRLAEWLSWNWWRLRWEPLKRSNMHAQGVSWRLAHETSSIGGGWLWPDVIVKSDGSRVTLQSQHSVASPAEPLWFIGDHHEVISAQAWEAGVDDFVKRVLDRLAKHRQGADLAQAWSELSEERADPELAAYRKIEACLGFDVDQADPDSVEEILVASGIFGNAAMAEVAAASPMTVSELRTTAERSGFPANGDNAAEALPDSKYGHGASPWRVGVDAARTLRQRERLGDEPTSDRRLAELCGFSEQALQSSDRDEAMAFALHESGTTGRVVFRSKWHTGRRFDAARLLADRVVTPDDDALRPATTSYTYRQKMQRAFAAEFLCPIHALVDILGDDLSDESQEQAARRFEISPITVNNRLMSSDEFQYPDLEAA